MQLDRVQTNYRWNHLIFDRLLGLERLRLLAIEQLGDHRGKWVLDFDKTIPDSGLRRYAYPLLHWVLRASGIDDPEELDDSRLRERWDIGKRFLRERLVDIQEIAYFQSGFLLSGRHPGVPE